MLLTLQGIDEAIQGLGLREDTLKARLVLAIRSSFPSEESLSTITDLPADQLIQQIWEIDSPEAVRQKRKNLSSLKSALNRNFRELSEIGRNPEGVVIGRDNTFVVSEEKKDSLIELLGLTTEQTQSLGDIFTGLRGLLAELLKKKGAEQIQQVLGRLEEMKQLVQESGRRSGLPVPPAEGEEDVDTAPPDSPAEKPEAPEPGAASAVAKSESAPPAQEAFELIEPEEVLAEEVGEEEALEAEVDLEEIDELEEMLEEPAETELEVVDEDQLLPEGGGGGPLAAGPEEEGSGDPGSLAAAEEAAELLAEDETLEAAEIDEMMELEDSALLEEEESETAAAAEEPTNVEEKFSPGGDGGLELTEDDFLLEEEERDEVLEAESPPLADDGYDAAEFTGPESMAPGSATGAPSPSLGEEIDDAEADVLLGTKESEDLLEIEPPLCPGPPLAAGEAAATEPSLAAADEAPFGGTGEGPELTEDDALIEEEELEGILEVEEPLPAVEDLIPEEAPPSPGSAEGQAPAGSEPNGLDPTGELEDRDDAPLDEEKRELVEEQDLLEVTSLDPDEVLELEPAAAEENEGESEENRGIHGWSGEPKGARFLEALSEYLEPAEALAAPEVSLPETQEEHLTQLLERFTPRYIRVPASSYRLGCPAPRTLDRPEQETSLDSFYLGQFPVTNDLFELFVRETGYRTEAERAGFGLVVEGRYASRTDPLSGRTSFDIRSGTSIRRVAGASWLHPAGPGSSLVRKHNHPVVQVSRADALAFAAWAGKRLPSEDEWEAAARGPKGRLFPWGMEWQSAKGNFGSSFLGDTSPVDQYGRENAGPFGHLDLLGNVYEWTATPYHSGRAGNTGPPASRPRARFYVLKGGSWASKEVIPASHRSIEPEHSWSNIIGFRCAV